jgi:bacterioferritin
MRGNDQVIERLNEALRMELSAIIQYMVHAEMQDNWGYKRLGGYIKKQAIDEMRHAESLIERILFLDGTPKVDVAIKPNIGDNVRVQFQNDLVDETHAVKYYNECVKACADAGDNATREKFEAMVKDEEVHQDWLATQLDVIKAIGYDTYLSRQLDA